MCFLCAVVFEFSKGLYIWRLLWVNSEEPQHFTPLSVVFCDISCLLSPNFFVFAIWRGFAIVMSGWCRLLPDLRLVKFRL